MSNEDRGNNRRGKPSPSAAGRTVSRIGDRKSTATDEVQRLCIEHLQKSNESLNKQTDRAIEYARVIVYSFSVFLVIATAGGVTAQYYFYNTISSSHEQKLKEFTSLHENVKGMSANLESKQASLEGLVKDVQKNLENSQKVNRVAMETSATMSETIATLNIGQQRLGEQNPQAAVFFAKNALRRIDRSLESLVREGLGDEKVSLENGLRVLKRPAWILMCEAYIQIDRIDKLSVAVGQLTECDCRSCPLYSGPRENSVGA